VEADCIHREQQPFMMPARRDGLVLKHWRRKHTTAPPVQAPGDATMQDSENTDPQVTMCSEYDKYNIQVDLPTFTDDEYDALLRSDDWSREETEYLLQMVEDFAYRWAVIWDRYDFQPSTNTPVGSENANGDANQALAAMPFAPSKKRTVEDLKARFYDISAKLMKQRVPEMIMDAEQYSTYEMLSKFDPLMERNRKMLATALMNRSMDEVKEEEFLLTELQRINMAAVRLDSEREELRASPSLRASRLSRPRRPFKRCFSNFSSKTAVRSARRAGTQGQVDSASARTTWCIPPAPRRHSSRLPTDGRAWRRSPSHKPP
jgi:DNA methyltransferase 1-associated protein 1